MADAVAKPVKTAVIRNPKKIVHECSNHYKCNFIPIWLSLNPNAL